MSADWLASGLIDGTLPWQAAQATTMVEFLKEYTLHDSYWITTWMVPGMESVAALRWDTFWSKERVPYPGGEVDLWPILLIRFSRLYQTSTISNWRNSAFGDLGISDAETRSVEDLKDAQKQGLALRGNVDWPVEATLINGDNSIELVHASKIELLCLDHTGAPLAIPDI